jgi:hypothetical protein
MKTKQQYDKLFKVKHYKNKSKNDDTEGEKCLLYLCNLQKWLEFSEYSAKIVRFLPAISSSTLVVGE